MERILFRKKGLLVQSEVWYSHSRDSYSKCHRKYSKLLLEYNAMHSSIDSDLERDGIEIGRSTVGKFKGLTVKIFDLFEHIHSEEDISKGRRSSNVNKNHAVIVVMSFIYFLSSLSHSLLPSDLCFLPGCLPLPHLFQGL